MKEKELVTRDLLFKKAVKNQSTAPAQISQGSTKQIGRYGENISRDETTDSLPSPSVHFPELIRDQTNTSMISTDMDNTSKIDVYQTMSP